MADGNERGKGRANPKDDNSCSTKTASSNDSILSRVAASASGLARSTLSNPTSGELADGAAAAAGQSGKSRQFGTPSVSSNGEASHTGRSANQQERATTSSFRSAPQEQHGISENEFVQFLDGVPRDEASTDELAALENSWTAPAATEASFEDSWRTAQPVATTVREQQERDGADVVALLSAPGPQSFESPEEDVEWELTPEEIAKLPKSVPQFFSKENSANLLPDFEPGDSQIYLGRNVEPRTAQWLWADQWHDVLNSYQDEVWGGLLPIVKEAREEIQQVQEAQSKEELTTEPPAVRRLAQILRHMQKN